MRVKLSSFSYKHGAPNEYLTWSEETHGGGFIFDCRCLPNPGREQKFKDQTGEDFEVIELLKSSDLVTVFLESSWQLIELAITSHLARGFLFLQISYGCTGGQHRSVFMVCEIATRITNKFGAQVQLEIEHRELSKKGLLKEQI